ncbi:MAG: hypothetical protein KAI74_03915 [Kiritimatiellae bacterium]|nr:hypothetical protein [Kiritimatiellia bacterium]
MTTKESSNIEKTLKLVDDLKDLADKGQSESKDYGCAMLYGVIRDCAYKIGGYAAREQSVHKGRV